MPDSFPQMTTLSRSPGAWLARLIIGAVLLSVGMLGVVYLAARFLLWPNIDSIAARYTGAAQAQIGAPLSWKSIETEWSGLRPSIQVIAPALGTGETAVRAERLYATLSLRALLRGRADFHDLILDRPVVPLVRSGDSLSLAALPAAADRPAGSSGFAQWLLQQPDVRIGGGTILMSDATDPDRRLRLDQVSVVLRNGSRNHQVRVDVGNAGNLAASLVVQAELSRNPQADPTRWESWSGNVQWEARQLALQPLLTQLPADASASLGATPARVVLQSLAGQIDPWMSLDLREGKPGEMRLRLRSDDIRLVVADPSPAVAGSGRGARKSAGSGPTGAAALRLTRLDTDLRVRRSVDGSIEIIAPTLELAEAGGVDIRAKLPSPRLIVTRDGDIESFSGNFARIDIGPTLDLAKMLAPAPRDAGSVEAIHRLSGAGALTDVQSTWQEGAAGKPAQWSVRGALDRASLENAPTDVQRQNPWALRMPEFMNLSGSFEANNAGGKVALRTPAASGAGETPAAATTGQVPSTPPEKSLVRFGGVLVEPTIPLNWLDSQLSWTLDPAGGPGWLTVRVDRFNFSNADGRGAVSGRYRSGGRGAGVVDFRARVDSFRAERVWRYLPHEVPGSVRAWIKGAFEAGTLESAEARWRGDINDFPYRANSTDGPGEFRFAGTIRDVMFTYAPGWPAIHGINGELVFERAGMTFRGERATILEVPVTAVTAKIEDLAVSMLEVEGRAQGDASQFLKFVNGSGLAETLGDVTRPMVAKGPATLALSLALPLNDMPAAGAKGRVDLAGALIEFAPAQVSLGNVTGHFEFTEKSLTINGLSASFNGTPVELTGQTTAAGGMRLLARGSMTADGLRRFSPNPLTRRLRGSAPYRAEMDITRDGTRMTIESDLVGMASDLPAPMAKTADVSWPLQVAVTPIPPTASTSKAGGQRPGAAADRIEASLRGEILFSAERARSDARAPMQLTRAALAVNRPPALPDIGLNFQFTGQRIDLDAWMSVFSDNENPGGGAGLPGVDPAALPLTVSLLADEVRIADRNLNKVVLGASRAGSQWLANLSAREVNGFVTWSDASASGKLTARLGRLEIPESQKQEIAASLSSGPSSLPAMDVTAAQFILGGLDLGALELVARNTAQPLPAGQAAGRASPRPRIWQLERLRLSNPAAVLDAKGYWDRTTSLTYRLDIADAGGFLNRLQLKNVVKDGSGALTGELQWSGSPFSMDLPTLGGTVEIVVRDGQFLKVEPGAAKLIGVLNLQALPKLLALDFRDIFARGFSFDELRGSVLIDGGVASTDSLAMRGLQAVVQIKGKADLKASTQDLKVVVVPELNGGLATLAYAAIVNPAIGLGAFLAQSLFSQSLSKALAYEIDVTGPWANPTMVERKRERFAAPQGQ